MLLTTASGLSYKRNRTMQMPNIISFRVETKMRRMIDQEVRKRWKRGQRANRGDVMRDVLIEHFARASAQPIAKP